ncbi:MAG: DUF2254 domain-containing protein [Vicinamibacteraceae bacterium]
MTRLRASWEYLRGTYWAVPSAMSGAAVLLSIAMIQLDQSATQSLLNRLSWVYTGGPEGARAVLSTIAASMITVAGVTFSITIVALTLASQQFGPRLLRNFLRDVGNQVVLGTFVATFLYCLLVLRTVRGSDDAEFVPHLSVTAGVILAMLSLGVLIFFIHHVATSIQASRIIATVADDLEGAIDRLFPEGVGEGAANGDRLQAATGATGATSTLPGARRVLAKTTGYVQAIDAEGLMSIAREHDLVVQVHAKPGSFVRKGVALLTVTPPPGRRYPDDTSILDVFIIGSDRTGTQDVTFFIDQLVELAVRALSPGINDPGTARLCVDRLEHALCHLGGRHIPSAERYDDEGRVRVLACPVTFPEAVESAFREIARHGRTSVAVTCRLLEAVGNVGSCVARDTDRRALLREATMVATGVRDVSHSDTDRELMAQCHRAAVDLLQAQPGDQATAS